MNRKYLYFALIFPTAAALLTICELFPPFIYERKENFTHYDAGYHWYLAPPKVPTQDEADIIVFGKPQEGSTAKTWTKDGWKDLPKRYIGLFLQVSKNGRRLRTQEILIVIAALAACLFLFNRRLFVALLFPALLEAAVFYVMLFILWPLNLGGIMDLAFVPLFILAACVSIFFLRGTGFDRFWKRYFFSIAAASLPWIVRFLVESTTGEYNTGNYFFLFELAVMSVFLIPASIIALPITYQFYKSWLD